MFGVFGFGVFDLFLFDLIGICFPCLLDLISYRWFDFWLVLVVWFAWCLLFWVGPLVWVLVLILCLFVLWLFACSGVFGFGCLQLCLLARLVFCICCRLSVSCCCLVGSVCWYAVIKLFIYCFGFAVVC